MKLQIRDQALSLARALDSAGVKRGDVVGIILPNCLEYPVLVLGCLYLGVTITPINPAYTAFEISRQLTASRASVVFSHSDHNDKIKQTLNIVKEQVKKVIVVGGRADDEDHILWDDFVSSSSGGVPSPGHIDLKQDVAILPFSSGTTGVPKGVALSQSNMVANVISIAGTDPDYMIPASALRQDTTIAILPMYHIFGLNVTMSAGLYFGAKQVIFPSFEPQSYVRALEEHRPTFLHLVPPLVSFLANHPLVTPQHLQSLRQVNVGAAPSGPSLIEQFYKKAASYTMYKEGWGSTEVSGAGTGVCRPFNKGIKRGSVSTILPNFRLQATEDILQNTFSQTNDLDKRCWN